MEICFFLSLHTIVMGCYSFKLKSVCQFFCVFTHAAIYHMAVYPYFHFQTITWVSVSGFSPNVVCVLILWWSGLRLLMGKFHQFLTDLSPRDTSLFLFQASNLHKFQWIFTKLDMCIDILEIWFRISKRQTLSIFYRVICLQHANCDYYLFTFFFLLFGCYDNWKVCITHEVMWSIFGIYDCLMIVYPVYVFYDLWPFCLVAMAKF